MKIEIKITKIVFIVLFMLVANSLVRANSIIDKKEFFVTKAGNDKNEGTKEKPFATIQAARDAIRKLKTKREFPKDGITVWIGGGVYELTSSFTLNDQDGGNENSPVIYAAIEGEIPRFIGGVRIPVSKFKAVSDIEFLKHLVDKSVQSHIVQVNLKELGLTDYGKLNDIHAVDFGSDTHYLPAPMEVFVDQQAMTLSRWPNRNVDNPFMGNVDRAKIEVINDANGKPKNYTELNVNDVLPHKNGVFEDGDLTGVSPKMALGHMKLWSTKEDIMVGGCLVRGYAYTARKIASFDSKGSIIFEKSVSLWPAYEQKEASMIHFYNLPEEIDTPEEYYINRNTGTLYLYPPNNFNSTSEVVVSTLNDVLVSIENCSHIRLRGLTFEDTRSSAVYISGGKDNVLESCTIRNTGILGVQIGKGYDSKTQKLIPRLPGDLRHALLTGMEKSNGIIQSTTQNHPRTGTALNVEGGEENGLDRCLIYNTGAGGVFLGGGDRKTLRRANNFVRNSNIYRTDRLISYYAENIIVNGCGNYIESNYLHDNLGGIIYILGNDHTIEYNEICRGTIASVDGGAIEIRQNPSQLGNVLRFNYIHDNARDFNSQTRAVYLDNETCGVELYGNVFFRNKGRFSTLGYSTQVIAVNGGYEHKIHNNIFIGNNGITIQDGHLFKKMRPLIMSRSFMLETDVDVTKPPYSTRYPDFYKIYMGFKSNDSTTLVANYVYNNVFVGNGGSKLNESRYPDKKYRYKNVEFDAMQQVDFVDENKDNFELKPSSPVFKDIPGFIPIPFNKMSQAIKWENK